MIQRLAAVQAALLLIACGNGGPDDNAVVAELSDDEMIAFCEEMDAADQASYMTKEQNCMVLWWYNDSNDGESCASSVAACVAAPEDEGEDDLVPCRNRVSATRKAFASCGGGNATVGLVRSCFRERDAVYHAAQESLSCGSVGDILESEDGWSELYPELEGPCAILDCVEEGGEDDDSGEPARGTHLECVTDYVTGWTTCAEVYDDVNF